jgi:energy-coupling factor transporter ATP-binding protein EcfA2
VRARVEDMNALTVNHLHFAYSDGRQALSDVSFTIAEGECVGLIGPNGAGKSTLLMHLNGILPEQLRESVVTVFERPLQRDTLQSIRREVGLLFQNPDDQLFCPTVYEDVAFGPAQFGLAPDQVRAAVQRTLGEVGLAGFEQRSPHHLSHGEKRRVCLAGILACDPRVILLDEPTSDLDPRGRRELRTLLENLPVTKLIASHDLELIAQLCTHVILLDAGHVVAMGVIKDVLNDEALLLQHGLERPHILVPHTHAAPLR